MVVPSLSALLSNSTRQVFSNLGPLLRSILLNKVQNHSIFFISPRSLDKIRVQNFLPPMKTLDISSARKALRNLFPIFASILANSLLENLIFFGSPVAFHCCDFSELGSHFSGKTIKLRSLSIGDLKLLTNS